MELRHLRYFVAVAECEHVSRAAERLHVSQPPLSRAIRELESALGVELFERTKQRVRLTPAGRALLDDAKAVLDRCAQLSRRAQAHAAGESGQLRVGYVDGAMHSGVLRDHLRRYRSGFPGMRIELLPLRSGAQIEALRRQEIDVGFLYTPPVDGDDVCVRKVMSEPLLLAMAADDPLARRRSIQPKDLDRSPWVALPRSSNPVWRERFLALCAEAGFRPDIRSETTQLSTVLGLIEAGMGRAFVQHSAALNASAGLRFKRLSWWTHTVDVWAAWRRGDRFPPAVGFLKANGLSAMAANAPRKAS